MSLRFLVACFGAILVFSSGVAVGQKAASSRFEMYERPTSLSEMESRLLAANLEMVHEHTSFRPGIDLPYLFYDVRTRTVRAKAHVDAEFLNKQKSSDVKKELLSAAIMAQVQADRFFPEAQSEEFPDPDFEVEFSYLRPKVERKPGDIGIERVVYAEYKKGELAIYHGK